MESKTLQTTSGKSFKLKERITAGDRNEIRRVSADSAEKNEYGEIKNAGTFQNEFERVLISKVVLEFDGSSENVHERLLDSDSNDYDFIVEEASKLIKGSFQQPK